MFNLDLTTNSKLAYGTNSLINSTKFVVMVKHVVFFCGTVLFLLVNQGLMQQCGFFFSQLSLQLVRFMQI